MSATTTSRKRQISEAQDMEQSTSAKEAKISKTEDQKVHASVPLNDVISSLEDHIRFTDDVMKKQQLLLEQELSPDVRKNLQEMLEMIEKRNSQLNRELQDIKVQFGVVAENEDLQHKKCQKGEEKPKAKNILKRLPCEMICHIFRYLPEKDLFNQMLSDRFLEKSAGYILQRRKLFLHHLKVSCRADTVLTFSTGKTLSDDDDSSEPYNLEIENDAALCEGYEEQKGNNLTRALFLMFRYYNCSEAVVYDHCDHSSEIPLTLEALFGPAPSDLNEKIQIGSLEMASHMAPLLGWLSPKRLCVYGSPDWLTQKELKVLIAGIDEIDFDHIGCVDKMVEACDAKDIIIGSKSYWSDESIISVVKANIDGNKNGTIRRIMRYYTVRSNSQWKELFSPLTSSYEETGIGDNGGCKIEMPKCTFRGYGRRGGMNVVEFVFH